MSLKNQIKEDIKAAMRAKETAKRDTLRNIQTAIKQIEVDERREVTDTDIEKILMKYAKQREDGILQFQEADREDLVVKESAELALVKSYLPEPIGDEELEQILKKIISDIKAKGMQDMGKIMGIAKGKIGSKADGARINTVAKKLLLS
ncbi:MAG: GatB/YqeY domain-containing protein [Sulfurovum sp.]|nr:GatB/YqeY domain-containing protein [Sulfurovum sp.]